MDTKDRYTELCEKIDQLEYSLACKDLLHTEADEVSYELAYLVEEMESLKPKTSC